MTQRSQSITPTLWFDQDAEDAAAFYVSVFEESTLGDVTKYTGASAAASGQEPGSTMTVSFELEGYAFVALNGGPQFAFTPAISFIVNCPTTDAVDHLWAVLSEDGRTLMPLDDYPFSDRYGWLEGRYGVSWQLMYTDEVSERTIVPSLMFVGENCGQAEDAIDFYTSVFDQSAVGDVARYGPDQHPDEEGSVMYADFTLAGQRFAAMDSAQEHDFTFTEAISFLVDCEDQEAVDYFWERLSADPAAERCGWLADRYGVAWQIVPTVLPALLRDDDPGKVGRVVDAMLQMKKLEIATLEAASAR